jgi:hypothetical protein
LDETAGTESDRPTSRPFGLADAMTFIIALGLGLALARPAIVLIADTVRSEPRWRFQTMAGAVSLVRMVNIVLLNFLLFLISAFLVVRLRRPRVALRSMICQPGFAALASSVIVVLAGAPLSLLPLSGLAAEAIGNVFQLLLVVVAPLTWVFLIATRRWNPEPGWIDALGRILGFIWMICVPAHMVLIRLPY